MKTNNEAIDSMIEAQSQAVNNWMDSASKLQKAFTSGNVMNGGQDIYKEWMDKQTNVFSGIQANYQKASETLNNNKPEEFFKNWYSQQMSAVKQMTDYNQNIYNTVINFGKPASEAHANFSTMNTAWTNIYNMYTSNLNNVYDTMMKSIPNTFSRDTFKNMFETNKTYLQVQEMWSPAFKAMQNMDFTVDNFKNVLDPSNYKKLTETMFGSFTTLQNAELKSFYDNAMTQLHEYFVNQNNMGKEYYSTIQNMSKEFPQLMGGDFAKFTEMYTNNNNVFGKSFSSMLNVVQPGKEKETMEATIALMDKIAQYSIKQSLMQQQLNTTTQTVMENFLKTQAERVKEGKLDINASSQALYNEWLGLSEKAFIELYGSDEFSKIKAEVMTLNMDIKRSFEKQFENMFSSYPMVYRTEMEEVHKTIYDLRKQVKELQTRLAANAAASLEFEDEEVKKIAKKK